MAKSNKNRPLTAKEKRQLEKQRSEAAKQAKNYHKQNKKAEQRATDAIRKSKKAESKKQNKKSSKNLGEQAAKNKSKIISAAMKQQEQKRPDAKLSREERYIKESEQKIRNLKPQDFEDGYYVDEFGAKEKLKRRAEEIRNQESEYIRRPKKPVSPKQVRRRRILLYSAIFLVVLTIGVILSLTVLFKTEKISVEGDNYYYEDQITAFSNVQLQQNIFIAAMGSTPQKIIDNLPYVEDVEIGFNIPDTVTIKVTDATPGYVIKTNDGYLLISTKGRILEQISDNSSGLPELNCDELETTEVGKYISFSDKNIPDILQDITESIIRNEITSVTGFDVTDTANIKLIYDGRITVNLGLPEDIDYKIRTAKAIITEKLDPNNTGTISGTLDVSSCSTTKISHYKPEETTAPATTVPVTTAPADIYGGSGYTDDYSSYNGDSGTSNDTGSYDGYSQDGDVYSDGYSDGSYSDSGYYDNSGENYPYQ